MTKAKHQPISNQSALPNPTDRETAAIDHAKGRIAGRRNRVAVVVKGEGNAMTFACPHGDRPGHYSQLLDTFGTTSGDFVNVALMQMLEAMRGRGQTAPGEMEVNAALAFVSGIEPANEAEAALAAQMAITNSLALEMLGRTRRDEYREQLETSGGLAVKLLRTFTLQAETLAKLRRGGGQTVRVEHVHVHAGGQAIVGNVSPGGGASSKSENQPHAKQDALQSALPHAHAPIDPLWSAHTQGDRLPIGGDA